MKLSKISHYLYTRLIKPHNAGVDASRHEFILNTLLSGLLAVASLTFIYTLLAHLTTRPISHLDGLISTFVFWLSLAAMLFISRKGYVKLASWIFIIFLALSGVQFSLTWGFGIAIAELIFALTIVVAGVLFSARMSLLWVGIIVAMLLFVVTLQHYGLQQPHIYWEREKYNISDAIGYAAIFIIMGVVSWLFNRETDQALKRARASEAALQKERDNLERTVKSRTRQLEELQLQRILELQPFVEFGRIGASLVHEIANPLTATFLQLETLEKGQRSQPIKQALHSLHSLERYLQAARKQIRRQSQMIEFSVGSELRQVVNLLQARARKAGVVIKADELSGFKLYGDVVKFNQLVANLLANAIDASEGIDKPAAKQVRLCLKKFNGGLELQICDHGVGISAQLMEHLFEPFHGSNKSVRSGLGIGLALVKQYVEQDFNGHISVSSDSKNGTIFTVKLKGANKP